MKTQFLTMKFNVLYKMLCLFVIAICLFSSFIFAEEKSGTTTTTKQKLAVVDFSAIGSGVDKDLGKAVAELIRSCFVDLDQFTVIDKNSIDKTLQEKRVTSTEQTPAELGKLLNSDIVVAGSILKIGPSYILTGKMVEVKSGKVIRGKNVFGKTDDQLPDMTKQLVSLLTEMKETYSVKTTVSIISTVSATTTITEIK